MKLYMIFLVIMQTGPGTFSLVNRVFLFGYNSSIFTAQLGWNYYIAKCGIAIACRPSVTLVDQDHIGWQSWKIIVSTISPTPLLFVACRPSTYSQGNMGKFGETRGGWDCGVLEHKSDNISKTHKDRGKVTMQCI